MSTGGPDANQVWRSDVVRGEDRLARATSRFRPRRIPTAAFARRTIPARTRHRVPCRRCLVPRCTSRASAGSSWSAAPRGALAGFVRRARRRSRRNGKGSLWALTGRGRAGRLRQVPWKDPSWRGEWPARPTRQPLRRKPAPLRSASNRPPTTRTPPGASSRPPPMWTTHKEISACSIR